MIQGWFDGEGQLRFEIELINATGSSLTIDALFDTGSTEWLVLSTQDLEILGWSVIGRRTVRTVQGEITLNVYAGRIILDRQAFDIPVVGSDHTEDYLLGVPWLRTRKMLADGRLKILTLE